MPICKVVLLEIHEGNCEERKRIKELISQHSKRGKRKISIFQFNSPRFGILQPSMLHEQTQMKLNCSDDAHFEFRFDWHDDKSLHVARS